MPVPHIMYKGARVPIRVTYKQAVFTFPPLGLELLQLFTGGTLEQIFTDDETLLQIFYEYVKDHSSSFEDAIDYISEQQEAGEVDAFSQFREAFWDAVVNFTNPQMQPVLQALKKELKKHLKSPEKMFELASSAALQQQESTQNSTPSERSSSSDTSTQSNDK